ncbi:MAG TPA: SRPBCC family protein [Candidatus Acidoferrales bacterium]|nr:SRPBCC family protein [Candidatus Acidoferrales bacterium]
MTLPMESSQRETTQHRDPQRRNQSAAATVMVERSIEAVFDFMADGSNDPRWQTWVSSSELLCHGGGVGATYRQSVHDTVLGGRQFQYRLVHHHRPVLLGVEALSLAGHPRASFRLTPVGPALTGVSLAVELTGTGTPAAPAAGAVSWRERLVDSLPHLKACLEQPPS